MNHAATGRGAVIFDLDGTLVDSGRDIALSANFVRAHFGLPEISLATVRSYVGDGVARLLQRTLGHDEAGGFAGDHGRPVSAETLAAAQGVFAAHYGEHLLDHTCPYPGTADVLRQLSDWRLVVATNKPRAFSVRILDGCGLSRFFVRVVGGDEPDARKPDPAHLALAIADLDPRPATVVMVGDSPNDVVAARAFGAVSVACNYGLVAPDLLAASGPDHTIDRIGALPELLGRVILQARSDHE